MVGNLQRAINGTPPGVLFPVTYLCINGIALMLHLAAGLRDVMIPGTSVMQGMVMMRELSIILCCSALILCSNVGSK